MMRKMLALCTALCVFVAFGAFGGGKTEEKKPAQPQGPQNVVFWSALGGANGKVVDEIVNRFNSSQSGVVVKNEFQGSYPDTEQKLLAALAAGMPPEICMLEISRVPGFVYNKACSPSTISRRDRTAST